MKEKQLEKHLLSLFTESVRLMTATIDIFYEMGVII